MNKSSLKVVSLLFALTFVVGAAFAATNGTLVFGGTVRINNVSVVQEARLEFASTRIMCVGRATSEIVEDSGRQFLAFETVIDFCPTRAWPTVMSQVDFEIRNTGNSPVEFFGFDYALEGGQRFDIMVTRGSQTLRLELPSDGSTLERMIIAPGETVSGRLLYNPLLSVPQGTFTEVVFNQRIAMNYQLAALVQN